MLLRSIQSEEFVKLTSSTHMKPLSLFEDFTLLLFIHMARIDGSMHPNEKDVILETMKELFPGDINWPARLAERDREYMALGSANAAELLKDSQKTFDQTDTGIRARVHAALYDIINANGRVSEEETQVLQAFKGWLTSV